MCSEPRRCAVRRRAGRRRADRDARSVSPASAGPLPSAATRSQRAEQPGRSPRFRRESPGAAPGPATRSSELDEQEHSTACHARCSFAVGERARVVGWWERSRDGRPQRRTRAAASLRGDVAAIGELLDRDVNWHGGEPNGPGSCRDHALRFVSGSEVTRGGRFELVEVVGAGDNVVVIMRPPAHGAGPAAPVASLATCRDDRVIEIVHCPDAREALAAAAARRTAHGCRQTAGCLPACPERPWLAPRAVLLLARGPTVLVERHDALACTRLQFVP